MIRIWFAVILLSQVGWAAEPKQSKPESLTAAAGPFGARVMLKDGQRMRGKMLGYDTFFVEMESAAGRKFHLPWKEIAEITTEEFSGDTALMRQYLTPEQVAVTSVIQPRDPAAAFAKALWPGLLIHGYGHKQAGDQDSFLSLAGAEIFGGLLLGFGLSKVLDPGVTISDKEMAQYLVWGGGLAFVGSWLWDLGFASSAARAFNVRHGLALSPTPSGASLLAQLEF